MIRIGICDDEPEDRNQIQLICENYLRTIDVPYQCIQFSTGEEVMNYKKSLQLLFLDIEFSSLQHTAQEHSLLEHARNGIEIMKLLEEREQVWKIVFISSHRECMIDAFGLMTLGFVTKPISEDRIRSFISLTIKKSRKNRYLTFKQSGNEISVVIDTIRYIEAEGHFIRVVSNQTLPLLPGKISDLAYRLQNSGFVRVHKSYLVNMAYFKQVGHEDILLTDMRHIPVGRAYRANLTDLYDTYIKREVRERIGWNE